MKKIKLLFLLICLIFNSAQPEILNDVKVENNKRVSKESIIVFGNIEIGKNYNESDINKILVDLYDTNFFSNIKLRVENGVLIVNVVEKKIIQSVILGFNFANIILYVSMF